MRSLRSPAGSRCRTLREALRRCCVCCLCRAGFGVRVGSGFLFCPAIFTAGPRRPGKYVSARSGGDRSYPVC
jgi:hypothetical protein